LLRQLDPASSSQRLTMQRGLIYAVVDEADSVLIDDASSPLVLSFGSNDRAPDADAHLTAKALAEQLKQGEEFLLEPSTGRIALTESGVRRCYAEDVAIPVLQLVRPWTEYVQQALRARYLFRRDVHYVVQNGEVRIVDETTGRIFEDRSWQDGLHQAIEASQNLKIVAEKYSVAQVTRQRFFRLYENLSGMTGTAVGCERELHDVYSLQVEEISLRVPCRRIVYSTRFFSQAAAKNAAVIEAAISCRNQGRAVLIGTRSISDSEILARGLESHGVPFELLNGIQNSDEAEIVSKAGQPGAITIATNLAGRGTDIELHDDVRQRGGLHVIVTECQTSGRMDRQLIGRCARQGDPGSAEILVSAEDTLVAQYGPWLANALCREADQNAEVHADFTSQLNRIQAAAERQQYAARVNMLRRDIARDSLLRSVR
jgi:preprotein translocase subunit SecA